MKAAVRARFERAVQSHQAGRLDEALPVYEDLLAAYPEDFDLLHLTGVLHTQAGRFERAGGLLRAAVARQPAHAEARLNLARFCERSGALEEALLHLQRLCELDPRNADFWFRQGGIERKLGRNAAAAESFSRALALKPDFLQAAYNLGNTWSALRRTEAAVAAYREVLRQRPDHTDAHFNLGTALLAASRHAEAAAAFEALATRAPGHYDALVNLGTARREMGESAQAVAAYRRAFALRPDRPEAPNNLASALADEGDLEGALAVLDEALRHVPHALLLLNARASTLKRMARVEDAIHAYTRALALAPDDVEARTSRSLCLLLAGHLPEGFAEYEWRWKSPDLADIRPDFDRPLWLGREPVEGRRILVRWEQGLGDTLQFVRYVSVLAERGAEVILVVQPELRDLLQLAEGRGLLLAEGQPLPEFDCYCPLLSLPLALGTTLETIPGKVPYLRADPEKVRAWQGKLPVGAGPLIGLAWSGRKEHKNDRNRSIPLGELLRSLPRGPRWVVLQKDLRDGDLALLRDRPDVWLPGDALADFSDTAALCACMDAVVSVDTSIAHLAGGLGKTLYLLLPHVPDWRWLMEGEVSPWYPSARLFRQDSSATWAPVLRRVADDIDADFSLAALVPRRKVLLFTHDYGANGAAVMLLHLAGYWAQRLGWQVDALVDEGLSERFGQVLADRGIGQVRRIGRVDGYDFALANTIIGVEYVEKLAPLMPVVLWVHESKIVIGNMEIPVARLWRLFRLCRRVVFQSAWQSEVVYRTFVHDLPAGCVRVIPNGLPEIVPAAVSAPAGAQAALQVISVGGVCGNKRQGDLARAIARVSERRPIACALIGDTVGMGSLSPEDQQFLREHPAIELVGPLERTPCLERVRRADVFVLASGDESQGLSILEAAYLRVPVVIADLNVYRYFGWKADVNCLTFPLGDVDALARCIERLGDDPSLRRRLTESAFALSLSHAMPRFLDEFTAMAVSI